MPGPLPKKPELRQRRNKSVSKRNFEITKEQLLSYEPLEELIPNHNLHPLTVDWWNRLWDSPQSGEFMQCDLGALLRLALLINIFWGTDKSLKVASEIRFLEKEFGLTPFGRRRLEWSVVQVNEQKTKLVDKVKKSKNNIDPRLVLDS